MIDLKKKRFCISALASFFVLFVHWVAGYEFVRSPELAATLCIATFWVCSIFFLSSAFDQITKKGESND